MTITRIYPAGWAVGEKLTSAQQNGVDTNTTFAADKRSGQTDTIAAAWTVTGILQASTGGRLIGTYAAGADADTTYLVTGANSIIDVAALTGTRAYSMGNTGALAGDKIDILNRSSQYVTVKDGSGTTLIALGPDFVASGESIWCTLLFTGSAWVLWKSAKGTSVEATFFSATGTWTRPRGLNLALIYMWAGGGGGGGGAGAVQATVQSDQTAGGGGGGGASIPILVVVDVSTITTAAVAVGAGGTGGAAGAAASTGVSGTDGHISLFNGTLVAAPGLAGFGGRLSIPGGVGSVISQGGGPANGDTATTIPWKNRPTNSPSRHGGYGAAAIAADYGSYGASGNGQSGGGSGQAAGGPGGVGGTNLTGPTTNGGGGGGGGGGGVGGGAGFGGSGGNAAASGGTGGTGQAGTTGDPNTGAGGGGGGGGGASNTGTSGPGGIGSGGGSGGCYVIPIK